MKHYRTSCMVEKGFFKSDRPGVPDHDLFIEIRGGRAYADGIMPGCSSEELRRRAALFEAAAKAVDDSELPDIALANVL